MVEIDERANLSAVPNTGTWRPGNLSTTSRCFDIICTGKCQINPSDYKLKLDIFSANKIPDFFTKNNAGEIVFAEPNPMCTIKMPKGHHGTIVVRLKNVSTEQTSAKDYVCLGIRENREITNVLFGNDSCKYIDMTDASKVELVPLISATKLPNYATAEVGSKVTFSDTNFDFGTVYRITINDEQKIEWSGALPQTEGKSLKDIDGSPYWYNEGNGIGLGAVKGKSVRMLAINGYSTQLASSIDGESWEDEGCVLLEGETRDKANTWCIGSVYSGKLWCVITVGGIVMYSTDETRTWLKSKKSPDVATCSLTFGNGLFMTIGYNKKVYVSADANIWEPIGDIPYSGSNIDVRILHYDVGNNRWMCASANGYTYTSKSGQGTWNELVPDKEENSLHSISNQWYSSCYAHGYFYALAVGGCRIARSTNGKNWDSVGTLPAGFVNNIFFFNGTIYSVHAGGASYTTGIFK